MLTLHYPQLLAALCLLWMPRGVMRLGPTIGRRRRRRVPHAWTHAPQDGTVLSARHEFAKIRNYIDLLRAGVGTLVVVGGYGFEPAIVAATAAGRSAVFEILAATLLIAVLAQTLRRERRGLTLSAPVFFIAGISFALQPALPGLCAFALAWALVPIFPNTQGFLAVQGLVFGVLAVFLGAPPPLVLLVSGLCFLPVMISLLARRPLLILTARSRSA